MPSLRIHLPGAAEPQTVKIEKEVFTIGRSRQADVCIPLSTVSKTHAIVERKGVRFVVRDAGSRNGVYLNGFRVEQSAIEDGDELGIGGARVIFYRSEPPEDVEQALELEEPAGPADIAPSPAGIPSGDLELDEAPGEAGGGGVSPSADTLLLTPGAAASEPAKAAAEPEPVPAEEPAEIALEGETPPMRPEIRVPPAAPIRPRISRRLSPARAPRRLPPQAVALLLALSLGVGIGLGYLAGKLDSVLPPPRSPGKPQPGVEKPERPLLGGPASLEDPETRYRMVFRLFLDKLRRTPLRSELRRTLSVPAEEIWLFVESVRSKEAREEPSVPGEASANMEARAEAIFEKFLGRKPEPEEIEKSLDVARGDPLHLAFYVVSSSEYAGPKNRRPRSLEQLARSLYADILDRLPSPEEAKTAVEALRDPAAGLRKVAELLADRAPTGPQPDENPEDWCRAAYLRFLLRLPSDAECQACAETIRSRPDAWKALIADLASDPDYVEY